MASITTTIPNAEKIHTFLSSLHQEFDMDARLSRYESLTPELIELAREVGLSDPKDASHALFISDFVITSSEVPPGTTDEDRRTSIIESFIQGLDVRTDSATNITSVFYLAQKLYIAMKRNDSYLAGKGLESDYRKIMLLDMYLSPYIRKAQTVLNEGPCNWEIGIIHSMTTLELPHQYTSRYLNMDDISPDEVFPYLWKIVDQFVENHQAEVNTDSPLPNVSNSSAIYMSKINSHPAISVSNTANPTDHQSIEYLSQMYDFLDNADKQFSLISLRGEIVNQPDHVIVSRNPFVEGKPIFLLTSSIGDVNVTELTNLLELRSGYNRGLLNSDQVEGITETTYNEIVRQVEDTVEDVVEKEIEVEVDSEDTTASKKIKNKAVPDKSKKGGGLISRIKGFFFGSDPDEGKAEEEMNGGQQGDKPTKVDKSKDSQPKTETEIVEEKVERTVVKEVTDKVPESNQIGYKLPEYMAYSIGVYALEDFRMFEEFDTLRETEYQILGALESNFDDDTTTVLSTSNFKNSDEIFQLLDGLDEVIENVENYYLDKSIQVLPKEILFMSNDDKHFILSLDGNEKGIVATIATTYEEDITDWQNKDKVEKVQRRTLQMRTGQLLSAREHTPFDRATERIYGGAISSNAEITQVDHAILSLDD